MPKSNTYIKGFKKVETFTKIADFVGITEAVNYKKKSLLQILKKILITNKQYLLLDKGQQVPNSAKHGGMDPCKGRYKSVIYTKNDMCINRLGPWSLPY